VDYVNASLVMRTELLKASLVMRTELLKEVGPKANVARAITDLLCDLEYWTKADAVMDGD